MTRRRRRRAATVDDPAGRSGPLGWMPAVSLRLLGLGESVPRRRIGAVPGSLPDLPAHERVPSQVDVAGYGPGGFDEWSDVPVSDIAGLRNVSDVLWVRVTGVRDPVTLEAIARAFDLHPLVMEDVAHTHQRPKQELYPADGTHSDHLFLILKMLHGADDAGHVRVEQVAIVIGPGLLLSFQEEHNDVFTPILGRLRQGGGRVRLEGADYLAYLLIDVIVDHYFAVIEALGEQIDALEQKIMEEPRREHQDAIRDLRRSVLFLRRSIWPLREVLGALLRDDSALIADRTRIYLRDAYDHTIQVVDFIETFRDVLATLSDLYLSSLSHRLNEVMKVLTVVGTIFIPLSFLAGIYGMNFDYMPELGYRHAYFIFLGAVGLLLVGALTYFRRRGWI